MARRLSKKLCFILLLFPLAACAGEPKNERWGAFSSEAGKAKVVPFGGGASEKPYSERSSPSDR